MHVYKRREPLSNGNKSLTQKPKICLTISNRNAFSKASQKRTFLGKGSFMSEKTGCDSDQKPHFKTKYKYSRKIVFFKRCMQHLVAGAAVKFLRCLVLELPFVVEIFLKSPNWFRK